MTTLVVGSLTTASDQSYQQLLEKLQQQQQTNGIIEQNVPTVRAEILDRVLDDAAVIPSKSVSSVVVLLAEIETATSLAKLLEKLASSALQDDASLEVINGGSTAQDVVKGLIEWSDNLKLDGSSIKSKRSIASTSAALPLRLSKRSLNGSSANSSSSAAAKKKANFLWALESKPSTPSIDESTLLTEEDLMRPQAIQRPDCDVKTTRKACKNCTCGLREILLQEKDDLPNGLGGSTTADVDAKVNGTGVQVISTGAATSSCGSCYLGDAFRCASCPYLGLPAFNPGEKVSVPIGMDDI